MEGFMKISARAARINAELTAEESAKRLGISRSSLYLYETGKISPPWEIVERMSEVYGYPKGGISFAKQSPKSKLKKGR